MAKLILQDIHESAAGWLIQCTDMGCQKVRQLDRGGVRMAGINGWLRMRLRGERLQVFGVIPSQAQI